MISCFHSTRNRARCFLFLNRIFSPLRSFHPVELNFANRSIALSVIKLRDWIDMEIFDIFVETIERRNTPANASNLFFELNCQI